MENFLICICISSPMGRNGLESYDQGETYRYERREKDKNGRPYYRVYPDKNSNYYETCGVMIFKKFFKHQNVAVGL